MPFEHGEHKHPHGRKGPRPPEKSHASAVAGSQPLVAMLAREILADNNVALFQRGKAKRAIHRPILLLSEFTATSFTQGTPKQQSKRLRRP
jgi:hypothetical protein